MRKYSSLLYTLLTLFALPLWAQDTLMENAPLQDLQLNHALVQEAYIHLHQHPELGNQEWQTQAYLLEKLQQIGFSEFVRSETAPTAVIALLDSGRPGPTIALRADMDARPTQEPADHFPRSSIDGLMHNCGHDAHSAMLLGAAEYLYKHPDSFNGKLVFLFQPAEEVPGGADAIMEEGILQDLGVSAIFAQHVWSSLPVGTLVLNSGPSLAGSNYFSLKITGQQSHGAMPSSGSDTLVAAAKIVADLADLPARRLDIIQSPVIISPTAIQSNSNSGNIIPSQVEVSGTIRAFQRLDQTPEQGSSIETIMRDYLDGAARAYGVDYQLELREGSPPTLNSETLYQSSLQGLREHWDGELKLDAGKGMFSEDFAFYTQEIPALYLGLGIQRGELGNAWVHSSEFTLHPDALPYGVKALVYLAQWHTRGAVFD